MRREHGRAAGSLTWRTRLPNSNAVATGVVAPRTVCTKRTTTRVNNEKNNSEQKRGKEKNAGVVVVFCVVHSVRSKKVAVGSCSLSAS